MNIHTIFALIAGTVALISYIPYIRDVHNHKTKPHIFSWISWSLMTIIYLFAQITGGAGIGALTTGVTTLICLYIISVAFKQSEKTITKLDWASFIISLASLAAWYFTKEPTFTVILIIISDLTAFLPTVRKSYHKPESETLSMYAIGVFKHILVICSLEQINFISSGYSFYLICANLLFVIMLALRRKQLRKNS